MSYSRYSERFVFHSNEKSRVASKQFAVTFVSNITFGTVCLIKKKTLHIMRIVRERSEVSHLLVSFFTDRLYLTFVIHHWSSLTLTRATS